MGVLGEPVTRFTAVFKSGDNTFDHRKADTCALARRFGRKRGVPLNGGAPLLITFDDIYRRLIIVISCASQISFGARENVTPAAINVFLIDMLVMNVLEPFIIFTPMALGAYG